jgi:hypothetical protein
MPVLFAAPRIGVKVERKFRGGSAVGGNAID